MKFRKMLPVLCMAMGLTFAIPLAAGATGTNSTAEATQKESAGWHKTSDGKWYYILENGSRATGIQSISTVSDGKTYYFLYYFGNDGYLVQLQSGPVEIGGNSYFCYGEKSNYALAVATLCKDSNTGKYYMADNDGHLVKGKVVRLKSTGKLYAFDKNGVRLSRGLQTLNGNKYYVQSDGSLLANGKKKIGLRTYTFDKNGVMSKTATRGKYLYRVNDNMKVKKGWFKDTDGNTYYATSRGRLRTGFQTYKGKKYYFDPSTGALVKNSWIKYQKRYYRASSTGRIRTGWFKVGGNKYHSNSAGRCDRGFTTIGNYTYYFNTRGVMQKGWLKQKRGTYYFSLTTGRMVTGWRNVENKSYYFDSNGKMKTGWFTYNGNKYYLDPDNGGAMISGKTVRIDGERYTFNNNGTLKGFKLSGSYSIRVNRQQNVLTVYQGGEPVKAFLCSTGVNNATPLGTFTILDKLPMHELNGPTWGFYCSHITSSILFHSIPSPEPNRQSLPAYKYNLLGQQASEGCIRLRMGDAYWIYQNCPIGTPVTIYDSSDPGPLGKPTYKKIPASMTVDPTDPQYASQYPQYQ